LKIQIYSELLKNLVAENLADTRGVESGSEKWTQMRAVENLADRKTKSLTAGESGTPKRTGNGDAKNPSEF